MDNGAARTRSGGTRPAWLALLVGLLAGFAAQDRAASEYETKAGQLIYVAQFVEWPAAAFEEEGSPIVVGVLGKDPFNKTIEKIFKGRKAQKRSLTILRFADLTALKPCHVLFVASSEKDNLPAVFAALKGQSILTVGETEGFASKGGIANFYIDEEKKVRVEVNPDAAGRANLKISSKLLKSVRVVKDNEDGGKK